MRLHLLTCGTDLPPAAAAIFRQLGISLIDAQEDQTAGRSAEVAELHALPPVPTRRDLGFVRAAAKEVLPVDDCPTEAEIRQRPDVPHQGAPELAPQQPSEPLRLVVFGADAALAAVAGQLTKWGLLWVEVAFVPVVHSVAAANWGLETAVAAATKVAVNGSVRPVPLIRDENGHAIVGYAKLLPVANAGGANAECVNAGGAAAAGGSSFTGEVWVDQTELFSGITAGVQIRPLNNEPGLAAAEIAGTKPKGLLRRLLYKPVARDAAGNPRELRAPVTGRAVQAGSPGFIYVHDGVTAKKPLERVTIYRHLFDLQLVR